jgi:CheY-like chemotaxis protein
MDTRLSIRTLGLMTGDAHIIRNPGGIVTDDSLRSLLISHYLREASDGLEAVQKAEELGPDLILLDIGLPKFSSASASSQSWTAWPSAIPRWA